MPRRPKLRVARDADGGRECYVLSVGGQGPWAMGEAGRWDMSKADGYTIWDSEDIHALWPHLEMKPGDGPREVDPDTMRFKD